MANFNLNKIILGGRLTADPELKTTPSGISVTMFPLAVNRRANKDGESIPDFFSVTAWRNTAEFVSRFFRKGSSICVIGSIQTRTWTDNNGETRLRLWIPNRRCRTSSRERKKNLRQRNHRRRMCTRRPEHGINSQMQTWKSSTTTRNFHFDFSLSR